MKDRVPRSAGLAACGAAVLWAALTAAGCRAPDSGGGAAPAADPQAPAPAAPPVAAAPALESAAWAIESAEGRPTSDPAATEIRVSAGGEVSGSTGCNRFTGRATVDGDAVSFSPLAATRRACPPPLMEQEDRVLAALAAVRRFAADGAGRLRLLDADGRTRLELRRIGP